LADLAGLNLDPWQQLVLRSMLRRQADGQWAAFESCMIVPRQNGKSVSLEAFDLAKLYLSPPGHLILHSAHLFPTAMESFRHLVGLIRNCPELWAEVARVSKAHGEEGVELHNGSRLRFAARTVTGAGRGFSPDDVVLDEAFKLPHEALSALLPALSAKPNPQLVYASSTGYPDSEILWSLVERGRRGGDESLAYLEWSADAGCDMDDRGAWAQANPALGFRLTEKKMAAERASMRDEDFARERLGLWADTGSSVIDLTKWAALADRSDDPAPHIGKVALAVDSDPNRARTTIAIVGMRDDGFPLVEIVDTFPGVDWAAARIVEICSRNGVSSVVIDKRSAAGSLILPLTEARLPVVTTDPAQMAQACGQFFDAVTETGRLRHLDQPELAEALKTATTRPLTDAWAWDRKRPGADITPLTAATLALWGWNSTNGTPKNAGRGRVIALG
jgi:phage terminase large subunit-like protein